MTDISKTTGSFNLLQLHQKNKEFFPYFLRSCGDKGYDILAAFPKKSLSYSQENITDFIKDLQQLPSFADLREAGKKADNPYNLPFTCGWFLYLSYETTALFEPKLVLREKNTKAGETDKVFPLAVITEVSGAVLFNRETAEYFVTGETAEIRQKISALLQKTSPKTAPAKEEFPGLRQGQVVIHEEPPEFYIKAVRRVKDYTMAGDIFQANISRQWTAELPEGTEAADLFAKSEQVNPAPFSALADFGCGQIISASPERLVKVKGRQVMTRPIAGTFPRKASPEEDAKQKQALRQDLKEQAEHLMIVDLERNDIGKIAVPGSVRVSELMSITDYAFVHHIESVIEAEIDDRVTPYTLLQAMFPGGTITGCPKLRTLQIIDELEGHSRQAYTGSLGYISKTGEADFNILIRTFMKQGRILRFCTGGGIVAYSDPERELKETEYKALGLLRALGA